MKHMLTTGWIVLCSVFCTAGQWPVGATPSGGVERAHSDREAQILKVLERMRQDRETYLSVPDEDGRMLRVLTEAVGARHVVEIGTSTGYSGLWICLGLQATGGRLTTFEYDPGRAEAARRHFAEAGVTDLVTVVVGDGHKTVSRLMGPIDLVFLDADKSGYLDYLEKLLPLVRPGGLILAHNARSAPDYVRAVTRSPELETVFYHEGNDLSITLKKR